MSDNRNAARLRACAQSRASRPSHRRAALACASGLALSFALASTHALAQPVITGPNGGASPAPPEHVGIDERGIDLISGEYHPVLPSVSIGPTDGGLSQGFLGSGIRDNLTGTISNSSLAPVVSIGGSSSRFTYNEFTGKYDAADSNGDTLVYVPGQGLVYTSRDGTVVHFTAEQGAETPFDDAAALVSDITKPTGERLEYRYKRWTTRFGGRVVRPKSVTSNRGYQIHYEYQDDQDGRFTVTSVRAINSAIDYCDPDADVCSSLTKSWPSLTISGGSVTDSLNRSTTTSFSYDAAAQTTTRTTQYPSGRQVVISGPLNGGVTSYSDGASTWIYNFSVSADGATFTTTVTDALGHASSVSGSKAKSLITSMTDARGKTTRYEYDDKNRLRKIITPEGVATQYGRDGRGNVTDITQFTKDSSVPARTWHSEFCLNCTNPATRNLPSFVTDPDGHRTDFAYNPNGTLDSVTQPAGQDEVRPQTRYGYTAETAQVKTASGAMVAAGPAISLLQSTSACDAGSTCANTTSEVKSTFVYDGPHRLVASVTQADGANTASSIAVTSFGYDDVGNITTRDSPLAGSGDTTRYRYDAVRQLTGEIDPDPDGTGAELPRAHAYGYNGDGQVTIVRQGLVNSQADSDWGTFQSLTDTITHYDAAGRQDYATVGAPSQPVSYLQYGYDEAGRLKCTTVRMNAATFGGGRNACLLETQGAFGPDRITQYGYDEASNVTSVTSGLLTADQRLERSATYTDDGLVWTETDGKGARTTYDYDGFDRLSKVHYPTASNGRVSSSIDMRTFGYDGEDHVKDETLRDGTTVSNGYDALGRLTASGASGASYTYDNLGRLKTGAKNGVTLTNSYDNRGNLLSQSSPYGEVAYTYDAADRRRTLTWPDGAYVTYAYDLASRLSSITQSDGLQLASFEYDGRDQRKTLTRPYGMTTSYGYNPVGLLASLSLTGPSGVNGSVTLGRSPAGQIASRSTSNAVFGSPAQPSGSQAYAANGLNQYISINGAGLSYDGRGNLANDGAHAFGYDLAGELTSSNGVQLSYDALGRLASAGSTRFVYDGVDLIAEVNSAGTMTRYVHGPGVDEPLATCSVAGCRTMIADERGSVIGTATAGGLVNTTGFDDYGQGTPASRFGFTGQAWLPEVGLYHYKARTYSPELGRFLQADPLGYTDVANAYQYVGNDPINATDPSGLIGEQIEGVAVTYDLFDSIRDMFEKAPIQGKIRQSDNGVPSFSPLITNPLPAPQSVTCKSRLTVNLFTGAGGLGHVGFSVDGDRSRGFYGPNSFDALFGAPGEVKVDSARILDTVTIPITSIQAVALRQFFSQHSRDTYSLVANNCSTFCSKALASVGVGNRPDLISFPRKSISALKANRGRNNPSCETGR